MSSSFYAEAEKRKTDKTVELWAEWGIDFKTGKRLSERHGGAGGMKGMTMFDKYRM